MSSQSFQIKAWHFPAVAALLLVVDGGGELLSKFTHSEQSIVIQMPEDSVQYQESVTVELTKIRSAVDGLGITVSAIYSKIDSAERSSGINQEAIAELRSKYDELVRAVKDAG